MSEYTTESPLSTERRQRRRRAFITIGILVLSLFFAFWYGLSYYEADAAREQAAQASRAAAPTCSPYDPKVVTPEDVTLNVYNSTSRSGLAGRTAKSLEDRGFTVKKIANDPTDRKTPKVAEVRSGEKGKKFRKIVLANLPKGTKTATDDRKDGSVDVALGSGFKALLPVKEGTGMPMCPSPSASASASTS